MSDEKIIEIKNHILEEGKEYRKNILFYLKWVLEDFEGRKETPFRSNTRYDEPISWTSIREGVRTEAEWQWIKRHYILKNGYPSRQIQIDKIQLLLEQDEIRLLLNDNEIKENIPENYIHFDIKHPEEKHYLKAKNFYKMHIDNDPTTINDVIIIDKKEYRLKLLSMIAYAISNNLGTNEMIGNRIISNITHRTNAKKYFTVYDKTQISHNKDNQMKEINEYVKLLETQKQIILQGPPGTGKTRLAKIIARNILKAEFEPEIDDLKEHVKLIQFHPSYSYEDFVRGITAKTTDQGIEYEVENKILAQMAKDALEDKENIYILIIDEINRANLSSVLGELIYALEYRDQAVESMYELKEENKKKSREIILPSNLYIIGTMNTADRSIGHIDYAIRRRFSFSDVLPDSSVVDVNSKFLEVEKIFEKYTSAEFEKNKVMLGHSYFIADNNSDKLKSKLDYQVIPLLEEYISDGVLNIDETTWKELKTDLLGN